MRRGLRNAGLNLRRAGSLRELHGCRLKPPTQTSAGRQNLKQGFRIMTDTEMLPRKAIASTFTSLGLAWLLVCSALAAPAAKSMHPGDDLFVGGQIPKVRI